MFVEWWEQGEKQLTWGTHYKNSAREEKYCKMPMSYPDDYGNKKAGLSAMPCEGMLH